MNTERQYTVRLPAAFGDYFSGTGMAQGTDVATPLTVAVYNAWEAAEKVRAGGGHSWLVTGSREVLKEIRYVAMEFLSLCGPGFSSDRGERAAAQKWVTRINNTIGWPNGENE